MNSCVNEGQAYFFAIMSYVFLRYTASDFSFGIFKFSLQVLVCIIVTMMLRRVWRYQSGNQNPYIEEEQTTQWPKENVRKDKKQSTKHTHKTRVTRTPIKTGVTSVASLSAATVYQGYPDRNHKVWNIVSTERYNDIIC
jgi:hypothetical protein